jgi:Fe2+ transport system protein FeoA
MLTRWLRRNPTPDVPAQPIAAIQHDERPAAAAAVAAVACPLAQCKRGHGAVVVSVDCGAADACRLRALGVYEGARVDVVDSRNGLLVQVRGSRIALGAAVATAIAVIPAS